MKSRKTWILILCLLLTPVCGCGKKEPSVEQLAEIAKQKAAIIEIEKLGGKVTKEQYDHIRVDYSNTRVTDAGLVHLKGLTQLQSLYLWNTQVADAGLEHLKGLTNLTGLNLYGTRVTDAGLIHLKGLTNLEYLALAGTKVTDAGLKHYKGLANLRKLELSGTQVTDEGIKELQEVLPNCKIKH